MVSLEKRIFCGPEAGERWWDIASSGCRREAMNPHFVQVRVAHSEPGQTLQVRGRFFGRTHQEQLFFSAPRFPLLASCFLLPALAKRAINWGDGGISSNCPNWSDRHFHLRILMGISYHKPVMRSTTSFALKPVLKRFDSGATDI